MFGLGIPPSAMLTALDPSHSLFGGSREEGGRVRWELVPGTGHGARLVLTHTGTGGDPQAVLDADRSRMARLLERLESVPTGR